MLSTQLSVACREVGFYSLVGHGLPTNLQAEMFLWAQRFHALPVETKALLTMDRTGSPQGVGYLPPMHRKLPRRAVGNNNEAFIIKRDRTLRLADNLWPAESVLPGFRAALERYAQAMENLATALLPLYAASLGVAHDYFSAGFDDPLYRLRLTHYPPTTVAKGADAEEKAYGIAPHVDTTFITLLAQDSPGLVVFSERRQCWIEVPMIENALVVNTGELLRQWTNDEFLSVKHFVNHSSASESRYSVPFFFNARADYPMACIPTCTSDDRPPRYPTVSYAQGQGVVQGE